MVENGSTAIPRRIRSVDYERAFEMSTEACANYKEQLDALREDMRRAKETLTVLWLLCAAMVAVIAAVALS